MEHGAGPSHDDERSDAAASEPADPRPDAGATPGPDRDLHVLESLEAELASLEGELERVEGASPPPSPSSPD